MEKGLSHVMISGIPTPEKQSIPIITLKEDYNYRNKSNIFIFNVLKGRNQQDEKLSSLP